MRTSSRGPAALGARLLLALGGATAVTATAAAVPADLAACLRAHAPDVAQLAACGDRGSIEYCLGNRLPARAELCTVDAVAPCFANAGCQPDEARIEGDWAIRLCEAAAGAAKSAFGHLGSSSSSSSASELRRRSPQPKDVVDDSSDDGDASSTATTTTGKTTSTTTTDKTTSTTTTDKTTSTTPTTTTTSTTSTTPTTTTSTTATSTTATTTASTTTATTATATDSTYSGASTTTLQCQTTTSVSTTVCPVQSTGTGSGKETLSCYSTVALYPTCVAGLLCDIDSSLGTVTCMEKHNALDASGIVIAIAFASGISIAVGTMCFFCCRERRQHSRMAKAAEAAAIARQAVIDSKRPSATVRNLASGGGGGGGGARGLAANDTQPLMPSPLAQQSMHPSESSGDLAAGPNPFADQHTLR